MLFRHKNIVCCWKFLISKGLKWSLPCIQGSLLDWMCTSIFHELHIVYVIFKGTVILSKTTYYYPMTIILCLNLSFTGRFSGICQLTIFLVVANVDSIKDDQLEILVSYMNHGHSFFVGLGKPLLLLKIFQFLQVWNKSLFSKPLLS